MTEFVEGRGHLLAFVTQFLVGLDAQCNIFIYPCQLLSSVSEALQIILFVLLHILARRPLRRQVNTGTKEILLSALAPLSAKYFVREQGVESDARLETCCLSAP